MIIIKARAQKVGKGMENESEVGFRESCAGAEQDVKVATLDGV